MFAKIFGKKKETNSNNNILIASLLVHAAKIDENYTEIERDIIKKSLIDLYKITSDKADNLLKLAEKKEEESNQIVEFTKEIKKYSMEFRLSVIEILWKIVYSDKNTDNYESNLIRRICGLLYVSDTDSGIIKAKIQNKKK